MYFQFEDYRPDTPSLDRAMSRREGLLISVFCHVVAVLLVVIIPTLPFVQAAVERRAREVELRRERQLALERERAREGQRFVFVQPLLDFEALEPPEQGPLSDQDRRAQAPERAVDPTNPLPFAQGNSPALVIAPEIAEAARGDGPGPDPADGEAENADLADADVANELEAGPDENASDLADAGDGENESEVLGLGDMPGAREAPQVASRNVPAPGRLPPPVAGGALGEAIRNLERYIDRESFDNVGGGGGQFGPSIQFDTMGVEFGPWIRRFVAQIKRNWLLPYAAMTLKGHSILTFSVHRDGTLTGVTVLEPSSVNSFNTSARNALLASNPTQPLPEEYPADSAFFTVTFYYNERPPSY